MNPTTLPNEIVLEIVRRSGDKPTVEAVMAACRTLRIDCGELAVATDIHCVSDLVNVPKHAKVRRIRFVLALQDLTAVLTIMKGGLFVQRFHAVSEVVYTPTEDAVNVTGRLLCSLVETFPSLRKLDIGSKYLSRAYLLPDFFEALGREGVQIRELVMGKPATALTAEGVTSHLVNLKSLRTTIDLDDIEVFRALVSLPNLEELSLVKLCLGAGEDETPLETPSALRTLSINYICYKTLARVGPLLCDLVTLDVERLEWCFTEGLEDPTMLHKLRCAVRLLQAGRTPIECNFMMDYDGVDTREFVSRIVSVLEPIGHRIGILDLQFWDLRRMETSEVAFLRLVSSVTEVIFNHCKFDEASIAMLHRMERLERLFFEANEADLKPDAALGKHLGKFLYDFSRKLTVSVEIEVEDDDDDDDDLIDHDGFKEIVKKINNARCTHPLLQLPEIKWVGE